MATEVITVVDPGGGADYTGLQAAWAAKERNLVTADEIQIFECKGGRDTLSGWYLDGFTTDATHPVIIRNHSSEPPNGYWDTTRYYLDWNNTTDYMLMQTANLIIQGLQFETDRNSAVGAMYFHSSTTVFDLSIDKCIFNGIGSTDSSYKPVSIESYASGSKFSFTNNMMYSGEDGVHVKSSGYTISVYMCNNTFDCDDRSMELYDPNHGVTQYYRNNIDVGGARSFYPEETTGNYWTDNDNNNDYNFVADTTSTVALGSHGNSSVSFTIEGTQGSAAPDLRLAISDTGATGAGQNLSSFTSLPQYVRDYLKVDITGAKRGGTWDAGAHQITPSANFYHLMV